MSDPEEPTQRTPSGEARDYAGLPGEGGTEIPVPERDDVVAAFRKVAKADEGDAEGHSQQD